MARGVPSFRWLDRRTRANCSSKVRFTAQSVHCPIISEHFYAAVCLVDVRNCRICPQPTMLTCAITWNIGVSFGLALSLDRLLPISNRLRAKIIRIVECYQLGWQPIWFAGPAYRRSVRHSFGSLRKGRDVAPFPGVGSKIFFASHQAPALHGSAALFYVVRPA